MVTYLEFCGIYSLLFFLLLLDTGLILDQNKINNCLFPRGQVFPLGIRLTRLTMPRSADSFKRFFSLCGIILEFGFFSYPKSCSWFFNEQRQLFMRLHSVMNKWQLTMRPNPVINEWQLTYFL